jgi:predicted regulator of Ras-like GTPase activity (Roadblock/LC7/MglB family)
MPTPQQQLDLDRIVRSVDEPIVIAIVIDADGVPVTLTKGVQDDKHWFWLMQQITIQAAEAVYDQFTTDERSQMRITLPTAEDARRLGILKRPNRRN